MTFLDSGENSLVCLDLWYPMRFQNLIAALKFFVLKRRTPLLKIDIS